MNERTMDGQNTWGQRIDGWLVVWMNGQTDGWVSKWMNGWIGQMDGYRQTDRDTDK